MRFPRSTFLTAMLSIASIGSSLGTCAMQDPHHENPQYKMATEQPRFCYHTLGEIACYAAPQSDMGPVVAMEAERIVKPVADDMNKDTSKDANKDNVPPNPASPAAAGVYVDSEREADLKESLAVEEKQPLFLPSAPLDPRYATPDGKPIPLGAEKKTPVKPTHKTTVKIAPAKAEAAPEPVLATTPAERPTTAPPSGQSVATPAPSPAPLATPAQ